MRSHLLRPPGNPGYARCRAAAGVEGALHEIDELLVRVGQGDRLAFRELVRTVAPRLLHRVRRVVPDPAQSEEIVQDVLLRVWERARSFDPSRASGWTWLYSVARNRAIDVRRQGARVEPEHPIQPEPFEPPDRALHLRRRQARVREALRRLPEAQREVLELAYFESMSFTEIAAERGIPGGTAKSRVRLAFEKLRQILASEEDR